MKKYYKYLSYVVRHKWFVMIECFKAGLFWRGIMHDMSKFLPSEFISYANFFYGEYRFERGSEQRPPKEIDDAFDMSWLKHLHRNKHHWQWWIRNGDDGTTRTFKMDKKYVLEMICDWVGAGKAQGYNSPKHDKYFETRNWYEKNQYKMTLHDDTRHLIVRVLYKV